MNTRNDYREHLKKYQRCHVTGKRCYTFAEARAFINDSKTSKCFRGNKMPKREYKCQFCNQYHVTSQIKKKWEKGRKNW